MEHPLKLKEMFSRRTKWSKVKRQLVRAGAVDQCLDSIVANPASDSNPPIQPAGATSPVKAKADTMTDPLAELLRYFYSYNTLT